jgi:copper chaperone CopZ
LGSTVREFRATFDCGDAGRARQLDACISAGEALRRESDSHDEIHGQRTGALRSRMSVGLPSRACAASGQDDDIVAYTLIAGEAMLAGSRTLVKILPMLLLGAAAAALAYIALRAPSQSYVAPTIQEVEAHVPAPPTITGEIPPGFLVRTFKVEGMCCTGCTGKIYKRLKDSPGVVEAAVNFDQGIAQVVVPNDSDVAKLEDVMHFDKYVAKAQP